MNKGKQRSARSSKIIRILLSAFIAFGLWFYVITVERTETEQTFYNVPVILDGEEVLTDRSLMLASSEKQTVTLRLTGNRSDLNKLRSSDITVLVDLTQIYDAGEKTLNYTVSFPGDVRNVEVVKRDPETIDLTVAKREIKSVPLKVEPVGQVAEGYEIDREGIKVTLGEQTIEAIKVSGPKDIVDTIDHALLPVDMSGKNESFEGRLDVILCDKSGTQIKNEAVTPEPRNVKVTIPVLQQKEVELKVSFTDGGGLTAADVEAKLSYQTVILAGRPSAIKVIEDHLPVGPIDLSQVTGENASFTLDVIPPEGTRLSVKDEHGGKVEVTVLPLDEGQRTVKVEITPADVIGVDEGKRPVLSAGYKDVLDIQVKGPRTCLDRLTAEDLQVRVDLDAPDGRGKYKATVTFKEPNPFLEVIGEYWVAVDQVTDTPELLP